MELTLLVAASVLVVGVGYVFVQRVPRSRFVYQCLLGATLFALATRDLFRPRERGPPVPGASDETSTLSDRPDDEQARRAPLFARLRSRVTGWLD